MDIHTDLCKVFINKDNNNLIKLKNKKNKNKTIRK